MTKQVQRRRGTATQHTSFTGAEGELSVNTTNKSVHVHDGSTAGGIELARKDGSNVAFTSGTLDGVTIGGTTAGAGTFTNLTATGTTTLAGASTSANITFGDNDKAIFGAGSALQIYHDGLHSYIDDTATGWLHLRGDSRVKIGSVISGEIMAEFIADGAVNLNHNNSTKLATTSTGIDVTGTVTADGLTVDGATQFNTGASGIAEFYHSSGYGGVKVTGAASGSGATVYMSNDKFGTPFDIYTLFADGADDSFKMYSGGSPSSGTLRFKSANNGDISFYEDTGTTAKFFWDASAERLGIGTTSPLRELDVHGTGNVYIRVTASSAADSTALELKNTTEMWTLKNDDTDDNNFKIQNDDGTKFVIDRGTGSVGIGTSSPSAALHVRNNDAVLILDDANNGTGGTAYRPHQEFWANGTRVGSIGMADSNDLEIIADDYNSASINFDTGGSERMRIDSSGNVGIGTSSPSRPLEIFHPTGGQSYLRISGSSGNAADVNFAGIEFYNSDPSGKGPNVAAFIEARAVDAIGQAGQLVFATAPTGSTPEGERATERMRIDSSGNVGIGTSSPTSDLSVGSTTTSSGDIALRTTKTAAVIAPSNSNAGGLDIDVGWVSGGQGPLTFSLGSTERMRIDSSGNVGIGTSSPSSYHSPADNLVIGSSGDNGLTIVSGATSGGTICFADGTSGGAQYAGFIDYQHNGDYMRFGTNVGTERMRIDSSGRVGIGTASPSAKLEVGGGSGATATPTQVRIDTTYANTATPSNQQLKLSLAHISSTQAYGFGLDNLAGMWYHAGDSSGGTGKHIFATGGSEAMRIDSSGNLLVGTTSAQDFTSTTTNGHTFYGASVNAALHSRNNANALAVQRTGTDGSLVNFFKDTTTVGSIGTEVADTTLQADLYVHARSTAGSSTLNESRLWLLGGDSGIVLDGYTNSILPTDENSYEDARSNIGSSSYRFKDLYLSGGVYLGGTGAANKLDDYEEGTFTPTLTGVTGGVTYSNQQGRYTKIGDLVYWMFFMDITVSSPTGSNIRMVFPFADTATSGSYGTALMMHRTSGLNISSSVIPNIRLMSYSGGTNYYFYDQTNGGVYNGIGNFTSGTIAASGVSKVN